MLDALPSEVHPLVLLACPWVSPQDHWLSRVPVKPSPFCSPQVGLGITYLPTTPDLASSIVSAQYNLPVLTTKAPLCLRLESAGPARGLGMGARSLGSPFFPYDLFFPCDLELITFPLWTSVTSSVEREGWTS